MKNPWIAAILNFFLFGGGYVYNGKRRALGFSLLLGWPLLRFGEINIYLTGLVTNYWIVMFCGLIFIQIGLAVDGFREAKSVNQEQGRVSA